MDDKGINIILTGSTGMIGHHVRCHLFAQGYKNVFITTKEDLKTKENFNKFLNHSNKKVDCIIHCAGVNRPDNESEYEHNAAMADIITSTLRKNNQSPNIIYTNSIQAELVNAYGRSKKAAAQIFEKWAMNNGSAFYDLILPNIYGEFSKPHHNSFIATFSHQILNQKETKIIENNDITLMHASDVCALIFKAIRNEQLSLGDIEQATLQSSVEEIHGKLLNFYTTYIENNTFPEKHTHFDRTLYNTFRSFIDTSFFPRKLDKKEDSRGFLIETVKAECSGQGFTSLSYPGVVRGNHFHIHKAERFLVLDGEAEILIRPLFKNTVKKIIVSGDSPSVIDIPTLHIHNIRNCGKNNMLAQFWADEIFDPYNTDTYACDITDGQDISEKTQNAA